MPATVKNLLPLNPTYGKNKMLLDTAIASEAANKCGDDRSIIMAFPQGSVIVVADGAGGSAGATDASTLLVDFARSHINENGFPETDLDCCALLHRADLAIRDDGQAGETTGVVVAVIPDALFGASVGDSGAWLILAQETYDLTGAQSRKPLLGTGESMPEPFNAELDGGVLIVATDGLWNYVNQDILCVLVRTPGASSTEIAAQLVASVRLSIGSLQDDVCVVVCRRSLDQEGPIGNAGVAGMRPKG